MSWSGVQILLVYSVLHKTVIAVFYIQDYVFKNKSNIGKALKRSSVPHKENSTSSREQAIMTGPATWKQTQDLNQGTDRSVFRLLTVAAPKCFTTAEAKMPAVSIWSVNAYFVHAY